MDHRRHVNPARLGLRGVVFGLLFLCALPAQAVTLTPAKLPADWASTNHAAALNAFKRSCIASKTIPPHLQPYVTQARWQSACTKAKTTTDAKRFFENEFRFYQMTAEEPGLLTGYFIPDFSAALQKDAQHTVPVYGVPTVPYKHLSRKAIDAGALAGKAPILAWLQSPIDRFFLQIQGSGFIRLPDGTRRKLQFAAKSEQPYTPIGRILIARGEVAKEDMSMQAIRDWLERHPDQSQALMQENASYVFFTREAADEMPKGAQNVPLTPGQSLAVDPAFFPLGLPVFIETQLHDGRRFAQLMVAQDTGTAIKGPLRGDIFFGTGEVAARLAGHQQSPGVWTLLLP